MNKYIRYAALFGMAGVSAFAQTTSFGRLLQGFSTEAVACATFLGIILCVISAIGIMAGGTHLMGKIGGLIVGLVFALGATPIVTWVQAHV